MSDMHIDAKQRLVAQMEGINNLLITTAQQNAEAAEQLQQHKADAAAALAQQKQTAAEQIRKQEEAAALEMSKLRQEAEEQRNKDRLDWLKREEEQARQLATRNAEHQREMISYQTDMMLQMTNSARGRPCSSVVYYPHDTEGRRGHAQATFIEEVGSAPYRSRSSQAYRHSDGDNLRRCVGREGNVYYRDSEGYALTKNMIHCKKCRAGGGCRWH